MHPLLAGVPAMAALLLWTPPPMAAQDQKAPAKTYTPHRLADGHPDLQGTYDLATMTPLERPKNAPPAYPLEDARRREAAFAKEKQAADAPISGNRAAPPKGGQSLAPAGSTTGANA